MHCGQPAEMCVDCGVTLPVFRAARARVIEECAKVMNGLAVKWRDNSNKALDLNHQWMQSRLCIARGEAYEDAERKIRALKEGEG